MAFFIVTFDLESAEPEDYEEIKEKLESHELHDYVISDSGEKIKLPSTVFAGKFSSKPNIDKVEDWLLNAAKSAGVNVSKYFVFSTDGSWSWKGRG